MRDVFDKGSDWQRVLVVAALTGRGSVTEDAGEEAIANRGSPAAPAMIAISPASRR